MFSWLEAVFYTLVQLVRVNRLNALLLISFLAYLCYQGYKLVRQPLMTFFQLIKGWIDDRDNIKKRIRHKKEELLNLWKHRQDIDWKSSGKDKGKMIWSLVKRLATVIPAFVFLLFGNLIFRLVYMLPFVKQDRKRFDKEMKPLLYFKNYRSFVFMGLGFSFIALILANYLVTVLRAAIRFLYFSVVTLRDNSQTVTFNVDSLLIQNLFNIKVFVIAPILAVPIFIIGLIVAWKSAWVNFEQYRDYNHNEEGDDRFATVKEIHQQYKKVPNKTEIYPGEGGIPLLHEARKNLTGLTLGSQMLWQNRTFSRYLTNAERILGIYAKASGDYYIEDSTTNMLGVGMTRSGKGEGHITTTIDINSRAEIQPSMVIADPKGEHYQSSYKTMRRRGYDVNVLSFQNMDWSMSYNPLALAIAAAKKGYYEITQRVTMRRHRHVSMRLRKPFIVKLSQVLAMGTPSIGKIPLFPSLMRLLWL